MTVTVEIDHEAQAVERVATQYKESSNFLAYIRALMAQSNEIEQLFKSLAEISDIEKAAGAQLDTIGEIVGAGRVIRSEILIQFFGFDGQPSAAPFGEEGTPAGYTLNGAKNLDGSWILAQSGAGSTISGGRFRDEEESYTGTTVLADPDYRLLIRAQIVKNHSRGTCEDIIAGMSYVFDDCPTVVEDLDGMAIGIAIGRPLSFTELALLQDIDIVARPAGVRIRYINVFNAASYFGFDGQTGAIGFGEEPGTGTLNLDGLLPLDGSWLLSPYNTGGITFGGGLLAEEIIPI